MATPETKAATDAAMIQADIVAGIKKAGLNRTAVMFKGKDGWRHIGNIDRVKSVKEFRAAQPQVDGLLILQSLSAEKISFAEIDEGKFIACHG